MGLYRIYSLLLIYGIKKLKLALVHCVGNGVGMSNRRNSFAIRQWTNYLLSATGKLGSTYNRISTQVTEVVALS